ncbi:MAG: right-handed parallel beta-helix repeat-containing protein, partial [Dehalococcoidia bacterium]|nr:right-handed parallel beta-helix repeat-containing protein [Dehalococcoidia bacterium]
MKGKLSFMWRVGIALMLVLSLGLVMAAPVSADVSEPTVAVDPALASTAAEYTIGFNINTSLGIGGTVTTTFPATTTVPATGTYSTGDITIQGDDVAAGNIAVSGQALTITLATAIAAPGAVEVIFTTAAGIENPGAGDVTLTVATSAEANAVTSAEYTILALPTVTAVEPIAGNVGDTMWVEVTGANYTGDDENETNVSTTTLNFGGGITVVSTKYVSTTSIDCQITITAPGAVSVAATTAAGTGTTTYTFTGYAAGTPQVDVWETYTPATDTVFDAATLDFQETTTTIQAAETASNGGTETLIVHADTYEESLVIDTEITLLSLSGADSTIIDGGSAVLIVSVTAGATIDGFTITGDATTTNQRGIVVNGSDVDDFAIQNNILVDVANDNIKVWSSGGAITNGLIDNNTLTGLGADAQRACILVESSTNAIAGVTISDNTISNFNGVDACEWPGIQVSEVGSANVSEIAITGNTISDGATGIKILGGVTLLTTDYAIAGNTITGQTEAGVSADDESGEWPVFDLENNIITGNKYGIELGGSTSSHLIKYNDISGNSAYGLLVPTSDAGTVDAAYNWWGDISG